jgi:hypothetical protein
MEDEMSEFTWREGTGDEAGYWFCMQGDRHVATITNDLSHIEIGHAFYRATHRYSAGLVQEIDRYNDLDTARSEVERYLVDEDYEYDEATPPAKA